MTEDSQPSGTTSESVDFVDGAMVLLVGFEDSSLTDLILQAGELADLPPIRIETVASLAAADEHLRQSPVGVLALGFADDQAIQFLESLSTQHPFQKPSAILLGVDDPVSTQTLIQEDRLFYAGPEGVEPSAMAELVLAGWQDFRRRQILELAAAPNARDRRGVVGRKVLSTAETLLQCTDLESLGEPVFEALQELIQIDQARLWRHDSSDHLLYDTAGELEASAVSGLSSFVARTGKPLRETQPVLDPRYDADTDGDGDGPFLAVPIVGPEQQVLGVLTARRQTGTPFDEADEQVATRLAGHLSPLFALYSPRSLDTVLQAGQATGADADLFRKQAVEAQARGFSERGMVLRFGRSWSDWTWWTLLAGFVLAVIFSLVGRMHDYAAGPAVVRVGQRVEVTAHTDAAVTAVEVVPLQRVDLGQPLVRLYGAPEASQIANLEQEFEQRLRQRLAAPGDSAVEASLIDVRTRLEQARAQLDQRTVRAPSAGVVGDVRVRPGQYPAAGEFLMSIIADADQRTVLGLIPGHFGPQLAADQKLRLTLQGYPDLSFQLRLHAVGDEVIGVQEARQALGTSIADAVNIDGPVVLVEARLPEASFHAGRQTWAFNDGMQGAMEIRVRSRPILFHLIPGLDGAFRGWND